MNNIDTIIKYLSGELDNLARTKFENSLATNSELSHEYESIVTIWEILKDQLSLDDLSDSDDRESFIAEVVAAHDLKQYRSATLSKKEQLFKDKIGKVFSEKSLNSKPTKRKPGSGLYKITLAFVAVAATLLVVVLSGSDYYQLASDYYEPMNDPDLDQYAINSRSEVFNGMYLYKKGDFNAAKKAFENTSDTSDPLESIFYALACYETGDHDNASEILNELTINKNIAIAYKSKWYLCLVLIKNNELQKATELLIELKEAEGIYQKKAKRLFRKLNYSGEIE